ncbi:GNAT family N-acetyltransferase [Ornithinicoccus halotolerans]|uniref:GNAT family N-acetyltransferase n=1 Tax=Ornithinicoccus halotolerans TaxID=1748220 RepID=UPI001295A631|nr:GNAT family N-acetyltransferase [Ornithinicoccus halotolerans]
MATAAESTGAGPMPPDADGYLLRPPRPRDAEELGRLDCEVWRATYRRQLDPDVWSRLVPEPFAERWRERLAAPPAPGVRTLVAVAGLRLAGFGVAGTPRDEVPPAGCELHALNLLPVHHGTGVADQLITSLLGPAAAYLWVAAGSDRAVGFCWRHGFRPDGTEQLAESGMREVRMVREPQLSPAPRQ